MIEVWDIEVLLSTKDYRGALQAAERVIYERAYQSTKYNKSATAALLGVSRGHVYSKLKEFEIL